MVNLFGTAHPQPCSCRSGVVFGRCQGPAVPRPPIRGLSGVPGGAVRGLPAAVRGGPGLFLVNSGTCAPVLCWCGEGRPFSGGGGVVCAFGARMAGAYYSGYPRLSFRGEAGKAFR